LIDPSCRALEIGPLDRPILTKAAHPGLFYADVHDQQQLHRMYSQDPGVIWEAATPIDEAGRRLNLFPDDHLCPDRSSAE
jgi:hypothetical protein